MPIILTTPRLSLREMTRDDLDFMAAMTADPEVMRYYPAVLSRDEALASIEKNLDRYRDHGHGLWLATLRATGEPVGRVGLVRQVVDGQEENEIGYMFHRPYWRQGLASEAAAAVRELAFSHYDYRRVISLIRPVNIPSQRTALAIGLKPEKMTTHYQLEHLVFALER